MRNRSYFDTQVLRSTIYNHLSFAKDLLGVEGMTEQNGAAISSEGLMANLQRTTECKAKENVTPDVSPSAFFLRVKVK